VSIFGIDWAWGTPTVAALNKAGVKFACRYLSHDGGKNLSPGEAKMLSKAGIDIVVIWETTAQRTLDGRAAGVIDAMDALGQAKACGMPAGGAIYFAVDWDAQAGQEQDRINAYLDGASSVLNGIHGVGLYAGYGPIKRAFDAKKITYGWQTYAWSGGKWDPRAQLQQYSNDHFINGVGCDYDRAVKNDFGQWRVGVAPTPGPTPTPVPSPTPIPVEDDMPFGQLVEGKDAVTPIALPKGKYTSIGFTADNGLQKLPAADLRVAVQHGAAWQVITPDVIVDSTKGQAVVTFPDKANVTGLSVQRKDAGTVHVAWEVS
jgi:hypothetical protein